MVDEIIYRTAGPWGPGKGADLDAVEIDTNFYNLLQGIIDLINNPTQPNQIANIIVEGNTLTFVMEDSTEFGPYQLPVAEFQWRDAWAPLTQYFFGDWFTRDTGLYLVMQDHVSDVAFNPAAGNMAGPYYRLLFDAQALSMTYLDEGWLPLTVMSAFEVFSIADVGVYMVLRDHTSAATFDPAAEDDDGNPLYKKIFSPIDTQIARVQFQYNGALPGDASVILKYIQDDTRDLVFPSGWASSLAHLEIAATEQMDIPIMYDGVEVGTITFTPGSLLDGEGGQFGAFAGTGATLPNATLLRVLAPDYIDATARFLTFSLVGNYVEQS